MNVTLAYGKTDLTVSLPDELDVTIVEPRFVEGLSDEEGALRDALRGPVSSPPLKELAGPSDTVGIVVNDITRPTPYRVILPVLLGELAHVPPGRIVLLVATGTHRANTEAELRAMLGDEIVKRYRIVQNDSSDSPSHALVGTTRSGNDIRIHSEYLKCDLRILTGFIEPHLFAGFSGGAKAVMPGLASLSSVLTNHSPANIDHPKARWGVTEGNPIWEEIGEAGRMGGAAFLLNVTLNRDKQITGVFAGDPEKAHAQGCAFARQSAMVAVDAPFDIVITCNSGYPLDLNLYQSVKGMSAAAEIVRPGGAIIIAADCWDGIPDHGEYARLLREAESPESLLETVRTPGFLRHDMWEAQIQAMISLKADVYVYSDNLSDDQIGQALLRPSRDIAATLSGLLRKRPAGARVCVLPEGPQTIPYVAAGAP